MLEKITASTINALAKAGATSRAAVVATVSRRMVGSFPLMFRQQLAQTPTAPAGRQSTAQLLQSGSRNFVSTTTPAQRFNGTTAATLAVQPRCQAHDVESHVERHGPALLTLYEQRDSDTTTPTARTVLVIGTVRSDPSTCHALVVDVDRDSLADNPLLKLAQRHSHEQNKALAEFDSIDLRALESAASSIENLPFRVVDLDLAIADHDHICSKAPVTTTASLLQPGSLIYDAASQSGSKLSDEVSGTLAEWIGDKSLNMVTPFGGSGGAAPQAGLAEPLWNEAPSTMTLLARARELAQTPLAFVLPPNESHAAIRDAWKPVFEGLTKEELAKHELNASERFMLHKIETALAGDEATLTLDVLQASGRLDPHAEAERLQQAGAYMTDVASYIAEAGDLKTMSTDDMKALVGKMVESARAALGFTQAVDVVVEEEAHPFRPNLSASVSDPRSEDVDLHLFPSAARSDKLSLAGVVLQECVHMEQGQRDADEPQGAMLQAGFNAAERGRRKPLDYPMQLAHEVEGWATELAGKRIGSHMDAFKSASGPAALYASISQAALDGGIERMLATHAKETLGLDMAELASFCGLGDATPAGKPPLDPFGQLRDHVAEFLEEGSEYGTQKLSREFRAQLLGSVLQVCVAADNPDHPKRQDARCLVAALHLALDLPPPYLRADKQDVNSLAGWCRTEARSLTTQLGRNCLYQVACAGAKGTGLALTDADKTNLRNAAGAA